MRMKNMKHIEYRLTKEYEPEVFGYDQSNYGSDDLEGLYRDYDVFWEHQKVIQRVGFVEDILTLRNVAEWTEDDHDCLWFNDSEEPIYIGSPLCDNWLYYEEQCVFFIQIPNSIRRENMPKWEKCEECGCAYLENTEEYNSIYQTGYCDFCLDEKQEKEKGGRGRR